MSIDTPDDLPCMFMNKLSTLSQKKIKKMSGLSCWNPVVLLKSCYPVENLLKIFESCSNPVQILLGKNAELATLEKYDSPLQIMFSRCCLLMIA